MDQKQKTVILEMVGTVGLADLEAIVKLLPENHRYKDPYYLASHLINAGIDMVKKEVSKTVGIEEDTK